MSIQWRIFTDGGARGNPGPAACAFVVYSGTDEFHTHARHLGQATNNEAEYGGLLDSLDFVTTNALQLTPTSLIEWRLDSKLVVEQVMGRWRVKEARLQPLCQRARELLALVPCRYTMAHVARSLNARADELVNQKLDSV